MLHSPEERDEELHQVHEITVLGEGNLWRQTYVRVREGKKRERRGCLIGTDLNIGVSILQLASDLTDLLRLTKGNVMRSMANEPIQRRTVFVDVEKDVFIDHGLCSCRHF